MNRAKASLIVYVLLVVMMVVGGIAVQADKVAAEGESHQLFLPAVVAPANAMAHAAAIPPECGPPATQAKEETVPVTGELTIFDNGFLKAVVAGIVPYTYDAHFVFVPVPAPLPAISDGCKENSRFTVHDFVGTFYVVSRTDPQDPYLPILLLSTDQPANLRLQVHFGPGPNMPVLTLRSDVPLNYTYFPAPGPPSTIRRLHIVGMEVLVAK